MGKGSGGGCGPGYYIRGGRSAVPPLTTQSDATTSTSATSVSHQLLPPHQMHGYVEQTHAWPKGLVNVGNTCYANAALQCLLSTALAHALLDPKASAIFRRYSSNPNMLLQLASASVDSQENGPEADLNSSQLSRQERRRKERDQRRMQETCLWLTRELKAITLEYHTEYHEHPALTQLAEWIPISAVGAQGRIVDPGNITRNPDRLSKCLHPYQQEDAHEFMRALLSTLVMQGQNRQLSSLFDGLLESAVTCQTCRRPSLTRDRYMDISVDIVDEHIITLSDALDEFTKTETLSGDNKVYCQFCEAKRTATKCLRLATAPSILVCHLKRFSFDSYGRLIRLHKKVQFPLKLEIGDYMSRVNRARPPPYELVAVLVHQGQSCESGHYLAYVKSNAAWFRCNDGLVDKVDIDTVLNQQAYILLYEVADMRENHGYPSPNKSLRYKRHHSNHTNAKNGFNLTSMMCGMDDTMIADFCCNSMALFGNERMHQADRPDYFHDDLSTLGDSTVDSSDTKIQLRRSTSSGNLGFVKTASSYKERTRTPGRFRKNSFASMGDEREEKQHMDHRATVMSSSKQHWNSDTRINHRSASKGPLPPRHGNERPRRSNSNPSHVQ